ncbi:hypothetical protein MPTK1_1g17350 [Marchantia polymorpha subsp. ruderalis]|uniref:DUF4371 domain-containing protein n=2 Tax=Marchantia polymorpha TaxID=3197 RepID=A0AAF6AR67_MARPO|nr:hypothetical protein MARPO_0001s0075 [Marchantia polymorpha]BBM98937.1 hypothetical protein Mp_1g17350 [Marchantia polymorpha subsp. ruderalis]|eukprot:PTQ50014.1 hypothetical protein MARPO_0001s0075 [Marchantia polymorpha]
MTYFFCLLIDEARDESTKKKMFLVIRFVNNSKKIQERFLDMFHVAGTCSESFMVVIVSTLSQNDLLQFRVRGQGYDVAFNMSEDINVLKNIIQREVPSTYYVHYFAHQLQLDLIASCKRADQFQEVLAAKLCDTIVGKKLEQVADYIRSNHSNGQKKMLDLNDLAVKVLEFIVENATVIDSSRLLKAIWSLDFVLMLHTIKMVLRKCKVLSKALQRKDQDIVNAMDLVVVIKYELQELTLEEGWKTINGEIQSFCLKKTSLPLI